MQLVNISLVDRVNSIFAGILSDFIAKNKFYSLKSHNEKLNISPGPVAGIVDIIMVCDCIDMTEAMLGTTARTIDAAGEKSDFSFVLSMKGFFDPTTKRFSFPIYWPEDLRFKNVAQC
jgi:hypothetical protein